MVGMPALAPDRLAEIVALRRDLHRHPELLYDVPRTAAVVAALLEAMGCDEVARGIGTTGVVGLIRGRQTKAGRMIGLRADMDALPIHEETGLDWQSTKPGYMHACGHDGHTAMLLGAARELCDTRDFNGDVAVIFQPAEEGGAGAQRMIDEGLFARFPVAEVYGMHNRPGLPIGSFAVTPGAALASVDEIRIRIAGKAGHAAIPQDAVDPILATGAVIQAVHSIISRGIDPLASAVVSLTTLHGGDAFNIIPSHVDLTGTVRALDERVRDDIEARLGRVVSHAASSFGAVGTLDYIRRYPVTLNHSDNVSIAADVAAAIVGEAQVDRHLPPTLVGEDFAFMLQQRPGAIIWIGNGDSAGLHHPRYDFDDRIIPFGIAYWTVLARSRLT